MFFSWNCCNFSSFTFLNMQLNLFLTAFSVLPGSCFTISDHLFPICFLSYSIFRSSSFEKGSLLISGFRKLYHRSLHCLPFLLTPSFSFRTSAISCHCFVPFSEIMRNSSSSSRFCHWVLVIEDLWPWFHLYWHYASLRPGTSLAMFCQSVELNPSPLMPRFSE